YASICHGNPLEVLSTKNSLQNAPPKNMPVITRVLWLRGYPKNEMRPRVRELASVPCDAKFCAGRMNAK
ncbi:MAG TPA: hypothetical protein VN836_03190, partial [Verrucomicrobiae bacterium]|nr:hypothetical protein [Verrucomicrobiae bacterium]